MIYGNPLCFRIALPVVMNMKVEIIDFISGLKMEKLYNGTPGTINAATHFFRLHSYVSFLYFEFLPCNWLWQKREKEKHKKKCVDVLIVTSVTFYFRRLWWIFS